MSPFHVPELTDREYEEARVFSPPHAPLPAPPPAVRCSPLQHDPISGHEIDGSSPLRNAYNKASNKQPTPDDCGSQPPSRFDAEACLGASDRGSPTRPAPRRSADPAPLGLSAFALTTFVLSLINVKTRSISSPNLVIGPACFCGGVVQLLAGMWYVAKQRARALQ